MQWPYLRDMARRCKPEARRCHRAWGEGVLGQWLDNPRLRRWRYLQIDGDRNNWRCTWEIRGERVDEDGVVVPDASAGNPLPHQKSLRLEPNCEWLMGLRVDIVREAEREFLVRIRHADGGGLVWVRFWLVHNR